MIGGRDLTPQDVLAILRRRIWWLIVPTVIMPVVMYFFSGTLPYRYTSQTLVLVEQQQVPEGFVKSVITEQLNMRLATMQEQILSRTRLQPLIERFGLYKDEIGKVPMEDLVDRLRKSINVSPVRADFGAYSGGLPGFQIGFTTSNPRLAQQVCSEITSMFIEENLKIREQRAQGTVDFLSNQLDDSKRKLDEQDAKLAEFKQKYMGQLPGQEQGTINMITTLTSQLEATTQAVSRAQQEKTYLAALLQQAEAQWNAVKQQGPAAVAKPEELEQQISAQQNLVTALEAKYTDDYPDVIKAKRELDRLQKKLETSKNTPPPTDNKPKQASTAGEPKELIQMRLQTRMLDDTFKNKVAEQERIQRQIGAYQAKLQLSPAIEEQYKALTRDHDTALLGYNELLKKKNESEMATDLEKRQQGEQFRVMDPPNLPEKPTFPNRQMFAMGGLVTGLAIGVAITLLLEFKDRSIRSERDVEFFLKLPTLVSVPWIGADEQEEGDDSKKSKWKFWKREKKAVPAVAEKEPAEHDLVGV